MSHKPICLATALISGGALAYDQQYPASLGDAWWCVAYVVIVISIVGLLSKS